MNWLALVLGLIPSIPTFVHGVETIAGHGNGADKKQAVLQLVGTSLAVTSAVAPQSKEVITAITPGLSSVIDGVVDIFNRTGVFKPTPSKVAA